MMRTALAPLLTALAALGVTLVACNAIIGTRDDVFLGPGGTQAADAGSGGRDGASAADATAPVCTPVPSLDTDDNNCGRCGHSCLGLGCMAGKCVRTELLDLKPPTPAARLALYESDAGALVLFSSTNSATGQHRIWSVGTNRQTPVIKADTCASCTGVALAGNLIYFGASDGARGIVSCRSFGGCEDLGGSPLLGFDAGAPVGTVLDIAMVPPRAGANDAFVFATTSACGYWSTNGVASLQCPSRGSSRIATNGSSAYWINTSGGITAGPLSGGAGVEVNVDGDVTDLTYAEGRLFWTTSLNHVFGSATPGVASATTDYGNSSSTPVAVTADASRVYWVSADGATFAAPIGGGPIENLAPGGLSSAADIAVDAVAIYVAHSAGVFKLAKP
jgi:hypothetical protein